MKIAIDYDNTISADFHTWLKVINVLRVAGHDVFVVTFRDAVHDVNDELTELAGKHDMKIYYTAGVAKRWWCGHFGPGSVDVWIDDKPESIINNSYLLPSEVVEWREGLDLSA